MEETPCDFLACALEEIALEGLDGITLSSLWVRLSNRPKFPIAIDEDSKKFIWECVAVHRDIEIFQLPSPRPTVEIYNRYDAMDPELGIFMELKLQQEIYPVAFIEDGVVRGSCSMYKTRMNITSKIRHSNMLLVSLNQALSEWGDHLVLVASPNCRLIVLIGTEANPLLEFAKEAYAVLERIGRSRYHGETSHGQLGLLSLKCENIHYHLAKLHAKGLVTKQKHYLKKNDSRCVTGYLYHLANFFVRRKTKFESLLEMMHDSLKHKPQQRELSKVLREELGLNQSTLKKVIYRSNQKWFQFAEVAFSEMFPHSSPKERFTINGNEKIVKVVQMIQPFDLDDIEKNEVDENIMESYFDQSKISLDKPMLCQVYYLIEKAGHKGLALNDITRELTIPRLDARQLCRQLHKAKDVITIMVDHGRQRVEKYICTKFENQSEFCTNLKEQVEKLKEHHTSLVVENGDESMLKENENESISSVPDDGSIKGKSSKCLLSMNLNKSVLLGVQSEVFKESKIKGKCMSSSQVTARTLKRCNTMIEYIKECKVASVFDLYTYVCTTEQNEGYNFKLDKKSALRHLTKLSKEGHLKIMRTTLKQGDKKKELEFVCDPCVDSNDDQLQRAIEQAKFRFFGSEKNETKCKTNVKVLRNAVNVPRPKKVKSVAPESNLAIRNLKSISLSEARKMYGLLPKFIRAKTLHLFLFYLVYKYEGVSEKDQKDNFRYHDSESWKRYIPPLADLDRKGWCVLADVIPRLPLSIFVKVVNMMHEVPNLQEYLVDKNKQHYLIRHLPDDLRINLLGGRRSVFRIFDVICTLCHMGLISFGPKLPVKEKEQVYIYVHKKINIKDTTTSPSGYIHIDKNIDYETKEYFLETMTDVETFWIDLQNVCTSTLLGRYGMIAPGDKSSDISKLMETCQNKDFEKVQDTGSVPGDGLGAAGLDSALFGHLRRNWCWMSQSLKPTPERFKLPSVTSTTLKKLLEDSRKENQSENRKRLHRIRKRTLDPPNMQVAVHPKLKKSSTTTKEPPPKRLKIYRPKVKPKVYKIRKAKPRIRRPYYDEKDKAALKMMEKCRTDWTAQEDSFLLVCKVTSVFLDPKFKRVVVPFTVIRDLLHEKFPQLSADKTSRACQRRLRYMLLNSDTRNSVAAFLGEAMQDSELVTYFNIPKPPKSDEENWKSMFTNLCRKLLEKFSASPTVRETAVILPDSLKLLEERYKVSCPKLNIESGFKYCDPESLQDIYREVIHGLVTLALATVLDKQSWCYLLYKLYDQYPEIMIKTVIDQLRKEFLITKTGKRRHNRPQTSAPCRFTMFYENSLITKFPAATYREAKELMEKLSKTKSSEVQLYGDSPMGYIPVLLAFALMKQVKFNIQVPDLLIVFKSLLDKKLQTVVEEVKPFVSDENSQQLVRLCNTAQQLEKCDDDTHEFTERKAKRIKLSDCNNLSNPQNFTITSSVVSADGMVTEQNTEEETIKINSIDDSSKVDCSNLNSLLKNPTLESNETLTETNLYTTSRLALNMLRQENGVSKIDRSEHTHDCVALNSCQVLCQIKLLADDSFHELIMNPKKLILKSEQGLTTNSYLVGKEYALDVNLVEDVIACYSSHVSLDLHTLIDCSDLFNTIYEDYSAEVKADGKRILFYICEGEVCGISHKKLWIQFKDLHTLPFCDHITLLLKSGLVLRVGSVCFRYVSVKYSKPWLLSSFIIEQPVSTTIETNSDSVQKEQQTNSECIKGESSVEKDVLDSIINKCESEISAEDDCYFDKHVACSSSSKMSDISKEKGTEEHLTELIDGITNEKNFNESCLTPVHFLPRIWKFPDGSINKTVIMKYLHSVLGFIMSTPGVSEEKICERFSLLLPPVQTLELLELLVKLNCVFKYYTKYFKSKSIFAPIGNIRIMETQDPDNITHYESFADAILKVAYFENHIPVKHCV